MNNLRSRKYAALSLLIISATFSLFAVSAQAQTASTTTTKSDQPQVLEKFEVTGSYIAAAADEAKALPVQVISSQDIELSGVNTNILDVLRKTVPQIQGGNNIGVENANIAGNSTNGGSQVALRNTDTLVLLNGKRMASAPVAAGGGYQFVDLNNIPISAVDRIEVLTDGGSALYGSDAVSGVINIILKKDYRGVEMNFHYSAAPNDTGGYWRQRSVSVTAGAGTDKTNVLFSAEWTKAAPLWERDVAYDNAYFGTASIPGVINDGSGQFYVLKSGLNAPPAGPNTLASLVASGVYSPIASSAVTQLFNLSGRPTIMNAVDKRIATANVNHIFSDQITFSGDFLYANTNTNYQLNPQPVTASTTTLNSHAVTTITDTGITIRNRFLYGPNRIYDNSTDFYRVTVGMAGKFNEYFNVDAYANYNQSYQTALGKNLILNSALLNGIYAGQVNMFARTQDPTLMAKANIFGTSVAIYKSELYTYNAMAHGKILDLPAGPFQYAAGLEFRKETLHATADYNSIIPPGGTTGLWNSGTSLAPFDGSRKANSYFAELKVPIVSPNQGIPGLYTVTLDGATRHEAYSDHNATTTPKLSLRWLPINDELALRATTAKSFTEPQLYQLYGPSGSGFTTSLGGIAAYNSSGAALGSNFPNLQGYQQSGANPLLKPAHAKSYTMGFVYSPKYAKGLEVTVDYYKIDQTDLIGSPAGTTTMIQSVEKLGTASPFTQYIALNGFPGQGGTAVSGPGQLHGNPANIYVLQGNVNIGSENQKGYDIDVKYTLPWKQYGKITIDSKWALLKSFYLISGPTDPGTEYSGNDLYGVLPKSRSFTTVDWDYEGYGASLGYTHINSVDDGSGSNQLGAYNTMDASFRVELGKLNASLKGISLNVGINNFTNTKPILDRSNYASPPFDASAYSFFGRAYYLDFKIKF